MGCRFREPLPPRFYPAIYVPGKVIYIFLVFLFSRRALKADSGEDTLRAFNAAMAKGVSLRANLLSGVLNQCAKAGLMDDCMRVVVEMKGEPGSVAVTVSHIFVCTYT